MGHGSRRKVFCSFPSLSFCFLFLWEPFPLWSPLANCTPLPRGDSSNLLHQTWPDSSRCFCVCFFFPVSLTPLWHTHHKAIISMPCAGFVLLVYAYRSQKNPPRHPLCSLSAEQAIQSLLIESWKKPWSPVGGDLKWEQVSSDGSHSTLSSHNKPFFLYLLVSMCGMFICIHFPVYRHMCVWCTWMCMCVFLNCTLYNEVGSLA